MPWETGTQRRTTKSSVTVGRAARSFLLVVGICLSPESQHCGFPSLDIGRQYGGETQAHQLLREAGCRLHDTNIERIFEGGLHEFLQDFLSRTYRIGEAIAADYRFTA